MTTGSEEIVLSANARVALGRKVKALRRAAITPIHVYGRGENSLSLEAGTGEVAHALGQVGFTRPLTIRVSSAEHFVIVREIQRHPVTDSLLHVDFLRVSRTEKMTAQVPVQLQGEAPAARAQGATLTQDIHFVEVEALPTDLPSSLSIDVSSLDDPDRAILASDLVLPPSVSMITASGTVVARVTFQRVEEEASDEVETDESAGTGGGDSGTTDQSAEGAEPSA